jgi:arylsulfatase A-like enzyme
MPMTTRLFLLTLLAFALSSPPISAADEAKQKLSPGTARPNIVYILSDDQSWTDYSFMDHSVIETPHLDKLAERSAIFPRGYVPTALCRPSLMTLATGLYTHQHLVTGNDPAGKTRGQKGVKQAPESDAYQKLRADLISHIDRHPTLPKVLGQAGYLSHQSGKWWEGNYSRGGFTHGMTRGFPEPGGRHGDDGLKIGREGMDPVLNFINHALEE